MSRRPPEVRYDGTDALLALCSCECNYVYVAPADVWNGTVWCEVCDPARHVRRTGAHNHADALSGLLAGALERMKESST